MTLTDFLLARIGEDEAAARACEYRHWRSWIEGRDGLAGDSALLLNEAPRVHVANRDAYGLPHAEQDHAARHDPARVLAECEAKRSVVEWCADGASRGPWPWKAREWVPDYYAPLRALALPYANHSDYLQEWKP